MPLRIALLSLAVLGFSVNASVNALPSQKTGQDPTAPLGWQKKDPSTSTVKKPVVYRLPRLKSIACDHVNRCNAVLNNSVVETGDKLNGYQVRQITDEKVTLVRGSKLWTLELFSLDIKN
ncbi:MSHA biogenesis protein MshK [Vibrio sp. YMD68]|uniref:MSHA biogenesis protein MshK n=1 Tax=Vibrio sp. YMD68 TaxID=3042300 RepID=UPI002499D492|nr:MSHA biogenesis protein MshK [Vibrio sp. YMD68]WGV99970.1 MSHA biogenesis protein MshK [Vibrio sp. YMD68]